MNTWNKRRKILRSHGWQYSPTDQSWDSPSGSTDFAYYIQRMNDGDFAHMVEINDNKEEL